MYNTIKDTKMYSALTFLFLCCGQMEGEDSYEHGARIRRPKDDSLNEIQFCFNKSSEDLSLLWYNF